MKRPDDRTSREVERRRGPLRTVLFAALPLVALLLLGEVLARAFAPDVRGTTYFQTNLRGLEGYEEDRDLFWKMREETDRQIAAARADAGPRMLVTLGGSIAQGSSPRHFTALLEERYRPAYPDLTVHNLALAGYTTHQSRVVLEKIAPPARPRVVLVCHGFNDAANWWNATDREIAALNQRWTRSVLALANRSRLFAYLRHTALQVEERTNRGFVPGDQSRVPLDDYRANLTAIAARAGASGGRTIFVTQAMPSHRNAEMVRPYFEVMADVAENREDAFLCDVRPRFDAERERLGVAWMEDAGVEIAPGVAYQNALFIDGDCHVTDLGYKLMADEIARVIDENGLLVTP